MTDVIRDLPADERPRERLLAHGPETLSDAELLAVVIGSGVRGMNAIQLARKLIGGGLHTLLRREVADLDAIPGVGPAKAARIAAAFEMSRRLVAERPKAPLKFDTASFGAKLVHAYGHLQQERLGAAFLDSRLRVKEQREIFVGTIDRTLVSTRDVVRFSLLEGATAVVIYHNHPSGETNPSDDDISFTRKLKHSLATMDIELVDHLVVGAHAYYSMKEQGLI